MLQRNKLCNILHTKTHKRVRNPLKEFYMNHFSIEEQFKKFEELANRIKEVNEFWINLVTSSFEDFTKPKKK